MPRHDERGPTMERGITEEPSEMRLIWHVRQLRLQHIIYKVDHPWIFLYDTKQHFDSMHTLHYTMRDLTTLAEKN